MNVVAIIVGAYGALGVVVAVGFAALRRWDKRPSACERAPSLVDSLVDQPAPADAGHAVDVDWLADQPAEVTRPKMTLDEINARIAEIETELAELR